MATMVNRPRLFSPRSGRAYRLEMESRTLFLLVSLLALTGAVIFSLGIVTGMGLRDPTAVVSPPLESTATPPAATIPAEETLAFNRGLQAQQNSIEGLRINQEEASKTTKELLARVERELKLEEVAATPKLRPPARPEPNARERAAVLTATKPLSQPAPGMERATVTAAGQYTVQVFSSRNRANARNLMLRLRKEGFAAYLNQFQGSNQQTWYRVRVGRADRAEAERLAERLKAEANMKAPRVIRL